MKRLAFIYNPASGRHSEKNLTNIKRFIDERNGCTLFTPDSSTEIQDLVKQLHGTFDGIVACGGDGTIRDVASCIIHSETTLGIIPLGSGNDLIKSLGIPGNIDKALDTLCEGTIKTMDAGRCNDLLFINTIGFGFDGLINRYSYKYQRLSPSFRYFFGLIEANSKRRNFNVTIEGDIETDLESMMVTIANGQVEGGKFWIAPGTSITDGKLSLVTIDPVGGWLLPFYLPFILSKKADKISQYQIREVQNIRLTFDRPVAIHADGEIIKTSDTKFQISVLPGALKVIC